MLGAWLVGFDIHMLGMVGLVYVPEYASMYLQQIQTRNTKKKKEKEKEKTQCLSTTRGELDVSTYWQ